MKTKDSSNPSGSRLISLPRHTSTVLLTAMLAMPASGHAQAYQLQSDQSHATVKAILPAAPGSFHTQSSSTFSPQTSQPKESILLDFKNAATGYVPGSGLLAGPDGSFYGVTFGLGGNSGSGSQSGSPGVAYQILPPAKTGAKWTEVVLHKFKDGDSANSSLVADAKGNLYGTTFLGGQWGWGSIFELSPPASGTGAWTYTTLHSFSTGSPKNGPAGDGWFPGGPLVIDDKGDLIGYTYRGGTMSPADQNGMVFMLSPPAAGNTAWTETALFDFTNVTNAPTQPIGITLVPGGVSNSAEKAGDVIGVTYLGGDPHCNQSDGHGCGVVFRLAAPQKAGGKWDYTAIHTFTGFPDGAYPESPVSIDAEGNVFGTTNIGGSECIQNNNLTTCGSVYELTPLTTAGGAWTSQIIHYFGITYNDGTNPVSGLAANAKGVLYGATQAGGSANDGVVFSLAPPAKPGAAWTETVLHSFTGSPDGEQLDENAGLVIGADGAVYGTTDFGGTGKGCPTSIGCGTVFEIK
jgi:uncharacterized repeat protein (TIGR03803 family)